MSLVTFAKYKGVHWRWVAFNTSMEIIICQVKKVVYFTWCKWYLRPWCFRLSVNSQTSFYEAFVLYLNTLSTLICTFKTLIVLNKIQHYGRWMKVYLTLTMFHTACFCNPLFCCFCCYFSYGFPPILAFSSLLRFASINILKNFPKTKMYSEESIFHVPIILSRIKLFPVFKVYCIFILCFFLTISRCFSKIF